MARAPASQQTAIVAPPNIVETKIAIVGLSPLVINKFSAKAKLAMMTAMSTPRAAKKSKAARDPRDFKADFEAAHHVSTDGWHGIAAPGFRAAMIDACRTVGIAMTRAKMSVFVTADGFDVEDGMPLVRIVGGDPERFEGLVRNADGSPDIRVRPMWREWGALVQLSFDADMITGESVINLLDRAGRQVGVGEGRPFSKNSVGMGGDLGGDLGGRETKQAQIGRAESDGRPEPARLVRHGRHGLAGLVGAR